MKRKETLGRLLLTLLTAFVMVAGAFVTASSSFMDEGTPSGPVAVRELDEETGEAGEAPASAAFSGIETEKLSNTMFSENQEIDNQPHTVDPWEMEIPEEDLNNMDTSKELYFANRAENDNGLKQVSTVESLETTISDSGTRAATVDAGGPYGTRDDPLYEGNPVNFVANIAGDINDNYMFRWDLQDDGEYEGPGSAPDYWGAYGDNDLNHQMNDNHIGEAKVEAWDGVSTTAVSGGGNVFAGAYYNGYWYWTGTYVTWGYQFVTTEAITIDEVGWFRAYYPYQVYYIDFWTTSGTWIDGSGYITGSQLTYRWNWRTLSSPISLTAGEYVVTMYVRTYYGRVAWLNDPTPTTDGVIDINTVRYYTGYNFPLNTMSSTSIPGIDFEYEFSYLVPDLLEGTADVFIDNVAPIVISPTSTVPLGQEGSEIGFSGWFMDPGLDDDWQYRWDWGDGTMSDWQNVNKYAGGAKVLLYHSIAGYEQEVRNSLSAMLGPNAPVFDIWSFYDSPGTLDMLLEYDVVIFPENTGIIGGWPPDVGDLLADYVDAGGSVVDMVPTFLSPGTTWGITGRWADEEYSCFNPTTSYGGAKSTTTLYWGNEPGPAGLGILDGVAGTISGFGTSIPVNTLSLRSNAIPLADYGAYKALAYKDYGAMGPGSGRIVSVNIFIPSGYRSGDALEVTANAAFWASGQSPPSLLPMPIQLETMYHTYLDDHPTSVTPEDVFDVTLQVKDDDHGRIFGGAGADFTRNLAQAPAAVATHSGGGSGVWGPANLNNGDKIGTFRDCWTRYGGGTNWNQLVWPSPQNIGGTSSYYTRWRTLQGYNMHSCDIEYWTGSSWQFILHYDDLDHGNHFRDAFIAFPAPVTTTRLRMSNMLTYTTNGNIMIQEWEVHPALAGGDPYTMEGQGEGSTPVTIENVFPGAIASPDFVDFAGERVSVEFTDFEITDPALFVETEEFWYRWDYGDNTPIGPWTYKGALTDPTLDILLLHSQYTGISTLEDGLNNLMAGPEVNIDTFDASVPFGSDVDLDTLLLYDVVVITSNYVPRAQIGNVLDDFAAQGGGVVELSAMMHTRFGIGGDYRDDGYAVFPQNGIITSYSSVNILDPSHPIIDGEYGVVSGFNSNIIIGVTSILPGATLVIDSSTYRVGAYRDYDNVHPGSGRQVGLNVFPLSGYFGGDVMLVIANAVKWCYGSPNTQVIDTSTHDYGDNGIYDTVLHVIDDDMNWAFGGSQPVFVGTGNPDDWVSMNHFPVEITNVDPNIAPRLRAEVNLDLVIRTTGEPKNDCTMTLYEGTTALGSVTVFHDGNYKMETLPATLDMGKINDYYVTVEYTNADPDGANPTWVFAGKFPSGHTKEMKKVFKEDGSLWTIDSSLLKTMLIGEDIVFTAVGADDGSDDLAFNWQFGDGVDDINVYANADSSMVEGASQLPEDIFNAHPNRDPWFDIAPNSIRSPDMNPIVIVDSTSHAFSEGGYFFVTLILMDDDVCDGYPSYQSFMNGGGYDIEFMEIDLS